MELYFIKDTFSKFIAYRETTLTINLSNTRKCFSQRDMKTLKYDNFNPSFYHY
jgi:hypothetical protein